jgi:hypothetical protein
MQEQDACLSGDRQSDLVSYGQTAAALKTLFGYKNLDEPLQVALIVRRQHVIVGDIALENGKPLRREGFFSQALPTPFFQYEHEFRLSYQTEVAEAAAVNGLRAVWSNGVSAKAAQ